ncbi:hypothetical protein Ocin01_08374 [Orchesella cincta]|uniref:Torsin-1A-interacting protein 2 n=1 Tax=Orchesella cincta TaxID=48709 RepID=A0A1D2MZ31_ORCCI|nr:hypothetical protein Ocin01_08374 [Orchesella cincta]
MSSAKLEGENGVNMAGNETLGQSLSDEELEPVPSKRREVVQSTEAVAPSQAAAESVGYKFQPSSPMRTDFGDQAKGSTNDVVTNSSSEDDFEHLNPPDENGEATDQDKETAETVPSNNSVPTTPTKNTPHKRTAEVAHGSTGTARTGSLSPPSSPASKKKRWEDFVKEDEENKRKREREKSVTGQQENNNLKFIIVAVIVGVLAVGAIYFKAGADEPPQPKPPTYTWKKANANFYNWTKTLRAEFPKQNPDTWIQLIASSSETLKKTEPNHPAVITALLPPSMDADFASCFLTKVGNVINKAVAPILKGKDKSPAAVMQINAVSMSENSITQFRTEVEGYFRNEGKVLLVSDVDKVKSETQLFVFHGLCDSFHAVDKRATIFFAVRVPQDLYEKYEWIHSRGGDIVNDVLTEAWKNTLSPDSGPAMVARVADAVILLNEGDQCKS